MTLLSAWALAGILLIAPLVLAHLRRRRPPLQEVPSLLIWLELQEHGGSGERRLRIPRLPLLLALQVLALLLLVLALARPAGGTGTATGSARVLVLDDSVWMTAPGRLAAGKDQLARSAAELPGSSPLTIVVSATAPYVLYRGNAAGAAAALARVRPTTASARLSEALQLAGALLRHGGQIVLARAPEDALPSLLSSPGELHETVATATGFQGLLSPASRCGIAGPEGCEVLASIHNGTRSAVFDEYLIEGAGAAPRRQRVSVPPEGQTEIAVAATAGSQVSLTLLGPNVLAAAAHVSVSVPSDAGLVAPTSVTLVGEKADALPVARALAAVSGVRLRLRTPSDYRPRDARASNVVVLDGSLPGGSLPPASAVLLIDPPRLPDGHVGAAMREASLSGTDPSSPLLEGVDLSGLVLTGNAARILALPAALRWVAWSSEGPLLAFGQEDGRLVAVLSFDPSMSDLPQLSSFPLLVANLLRALTDHGQTPGAASSAPREQASLVDLRVPAAGLAGDARKSLAPWLLLVALLVLAGEAAYAARLRTQALSV